MQTASRARDGSLKPVTVLRRRALMESLWVLSNWPPLAVKLQRGTRVPLFALLQAVVVRGVCPPEEWKWMLHLARSLCSEWRSALRGPLLVSSTGEAG